MRFGFTPHGWGDYTFWQAADRATLKRINRLLDDIARDPLAGIGKSEQLRHALAGAWSRRTDGEHRLVYLVEALELLFEDDAGIEVAEPPIIVPMHRERAAGTLGSILRQS